MKIIKRLNEIEIRSIIANYFNTTPNNVNLKAQEICVGYGPTEHDEIIIECEIESLEDIDKKSSY